MTETRSPERRGFFRQLLGTDEHAPNRAPWRRVPEVGAGDGDVLWSGWTGDGELFVVGDEGRILHFTGEADAQGQLWHPMPVPANMPLHGIWGLNANNLYAVGWMGSLLHYDGEQWQQLRFAGGINKMQAGTPLAYLTGQQAFWSLEFKVNEHTLIPRPDTEVLVEQVLAWIEANVNVADTRSPNRNSLSNSLNNSPSPKPFQLLDLGTGSGCIAISLAHELGLQSEDWQVTAVDYSKGALDIAKQNAILNDTPNVTFIQSDWFSALPNDIKYQVIVSNPPYKDPVDTHLDKLSAEPLSALVADDKGLADIQRIVSGAIDYLVQGGLLAIEHGYDQGDAVQQIFTDAGFANVQTVKDYGGNDRVTMGELS